MISRIWHGWTTSENADTYENLLKTEIFPIKEGRDGSQGLAQVIEINSPLKLVILMLGTNDFQCKHENNASLAVLG